MKVFLLFFATLFAGYHFLKEDNGKAGAAATSKVDLPSWFQPERWDAATRSRNLEELRSAKKQIDAFIANPPCFTWRGKTRQAVVGKKEYEQRDQFAAMIAELERYETVY